MYIDHINIFEKLKDDPMAFLDYKYFLHRHSNIKQEIDSNIEYF